MEKKPSQVIVGIKLLGAVALGVICVMLIANAF